MTSALRDVAAWAVLAFEVALAWWVFSGEWRHRERLYPTPQAPKPCHHGWRCWHCGVWLLTERITGWRGWRKS